MAFVKNPRVFVAGLFHETNTFVETPTCLADFKIRRDAEILDALGDGSPMDGFLETAHDFRWEVIPGVQYFASPSGPVDDDVFTAFWSELLPRLRAALDGGIDAIFLILHGAMATNGCDDVEGELLEKIGSTPGAADLPVFAVLDLHANVSEAMVRHASALIPYRENPHIDARQTAVRGAQLLWRCLAAGDTPRTHFLHSGIVLAPPDTGTDGPVMGPLEATARGLEESGGYMEVGIAAGFAHADTRFTGLSFWVVSSQPEITCFRALESLFGQAQALARQLQPSEWTVDAALDRIEAEKKFPALLVEPADNIGGGAPGDATFLLRALLQRPIGRAGVILHDPAAVSALQDTTPGETVRLSLGGRGSRLDPGPVELDVTLVRLTDGKFELEDRQSHMASMGGCFIDMQACAVVTHGHLTILLTSKRTAPMDLGQWRSQGIDPESLEIITVKAAVAHRRAYDPITASTFTVKTPGPCSSDLGSLPYRRLRRPI